MPKQKNSVVKKYLITASNFDLLVGVTKYVGVTVNEQRV